MRREFQKSVKIAAWQRSGGVCECGCGVKIVAGDGPEYDHRLEATLGGEPTLDNCVVMRRRCHSAKTLERRPEIDKGRGIFEKRIGARTKRSTFAGARSSRWKKKMNGEVVER